MRELRVIGLDADGENVIFQEPGTGEKFSVPADDRLRAAARGDLSRLGQIEIEAESTLRPREIQARIRSGASVEQVAAQAGVSTARVERFAHPVLLERARAAELAMAAHPVRSDGPAAQTLAEVVATAFGARGQDPSTAEWDAWKGEDGNWIAQLIWRTGHSDNKAHWRFQRDGHGGTVVALDDAATGLIDPDFSRPLRTLTPVSRLTGSDRQQIVAEACPPAIAEGDRTVDVDAYSVDDEPMEPIEESTDSDEVSSESVAPAELALSAARTGTDSATPDPTSHAGSSPQAAQSKTKKGKPAMPSWEDVLLGVRSNGRG
ncbi:DUF3071 domain-containing protein [Rhodococcus sp. D2-41]|uniref:septation protein SepH n=1 Tax=Speluncibacter jeojiensis TaxID=2710754 RepID=UPI00240FA1D9|nr:septation protein SepH [Rhodococcus sp. D2-41]MDG3011760.1 DUF3071 domain-containing protein [Rhodococcus sp. D2-41]